jgi:hypothetical protein
MTGRMTESRELAMAGVFDWLGVGDDPKAVWVSPRTGTRRGITGMSRSHIRNAIALTYRRLQGPQRVWPNPLKEVPALANMIIMAHAEGDERPPILSGTNWPWGDRAEVYDHTILEAMHHLPGFEDTVFSLGVDEMSNSIAARMRANANKKGVNTSHEFNTGNDMEDVKMSDKQTFMATFTKTAKLGLENAQNGVVYGATLAALNDAIKDYEVFLPDWLADEKTKAAAIWFFGTVGYSAIEQVEAEIPFMGLVKTLLRGASLGAAAHFGIEGGAVVYGLVKRLVAYINVYLRKDGMQIDMDGNLSPAQIEQNDDIREELNEMKEMLRSLAAHPSGTVSLKAVN